MGWVDVTQDRDKLWALVDAVMNLGVPSDDVMSMNMGR